MKDAKYLFAYVVPLLMFLAIYNLGIWSFAVVIFAFGLVPLLDGIIPTDASNLPQNEILAKSKSRFFDILLYLNLPIVYALCGYWLFTLSTTTLHVYELIGLSLSMAAVLASCGINVAHELGHRNGWINAQFAKFLLLPSMYIHFTIEHNRGHHKNVATPMDAATAAKNQSLYAFWVKCVTGTWLGAWRIESARLKKLNVSQWNLQNAMLQGIALQLIFLTLVWMIFGSFALLMMVITAIVSFLFLETINYVEHYGLQRKQIANGVYERAVAKHSWNSNHVLGRIVLFELTRHSDHHYYANKKYQLLNHHNDAPQLPQGYPASMLMALFPPLWFKRINPLLTKYANTN